MPQESMEKMGPVEIAHDAPPVIEIITEDGAFVETVADGAAAQEKMEQWNIHDTSYEYTVAPFGVEIDEVDPATNTAKHWKKSSGFSLWKKKRSEVQ